MPNADGTKSGGRIKGTPNKNTRRFKEAVEEAFERAGGVEYLVQLSQSEPKVFGTVLGKLIPRDLKIETDLIRVKLVRDYAARDESAS